MLHLQLMHESVARFAESFAAFLYGMNVNAFCVDFGEAPVAESWVREREGRLSEGVLGGVGGVGGGGAGGEHDATFL
jgi:DASH complex subunit DAM1